MSKDRSHRLGAATLLRGFFQMRQRLFGMPCRCFSVLFLSFADRRLEMRNALLRVRIGFRLLGRVGMVESGFGMGDDAIRLALLRWLSFVWLIASAK